MTSGLQWPVGLRTCCYSCTLLRPSKTDWRGLQSRILSSSLGVPVCPRMKCRLSPQEKQGGPLQRCGRCNSSWSLLAADCVPFTSPASPVGSGPVPPLGTPPCFLRSDGPPERGKTWCDGMSSFSQKKKTWRGAKPCLTEAGGGSLLLETRRVALRASQLRPCCW